VNLHHSFFQAAEVGQLISWSEFVLCNRNLNSELKSASAGLLKFLEWGSALCLPILVFCSFFTLHDSGCSSGQAVHELIFVDPVNILEDHITKEDLYPSFLKKLCENTLSN
jgi:hypothetical protein